ncbi:MAG: ABC transporter substrate-binding protein [Thaumarchaeota archaeon]|nr:ABC transporter substrate-binding protein [Nitrososphaerota archaeon]
MSALLVLPGLLPAGAQTNSTLRIGIVGLPETTFMQSGTTGFGTWTQFPYLYCYQFGFAGVVKQDVCDTPSAITGSNDQQWVVNLKSPNMKWSDGVPMNSTDLAYSFGIYLPHGPYANLSAFDIWGNLRGTVTSISVMNSTAIQINTAKPDPLFAMLTWLYPVYPYHYFKQFTGNNTLQTTPILGGPGDSAYVPQDYTANSPTLTAVANPYSPDWNGTTPKIHTVIYQIFTTDSALVNALASGQVDSGMITSSDAQTLSSVPSLTETGLPSNTQMEFFINPAVYPYNNTAFRQAMMYLVPKAQINQLLYNNQSTLGNPLLLSPLAYNTYWPSSSTPMYNYNPTTAISRLQAAGLTKNSAGNWAMANGTVLTVQFVAPNSDPDVVRAAQQIASSMQNVGLKVNLQITDYNTVTNDKYNIPNTYNIVLFPDSYFPSPFKWMRNPVNLPTAWVNSTFKADFAAALSNPDPAQALTQLKSALNVLANSAVTNSVLYEPFEAAYNSQGFNGWQPALNNAGSFDVFYYPVLSQQVLTSLAPASVGSSSSTTSTSSSSTTSSSASSTAINTSTAVAMVGVAVFIAVVYASSVLRRPGRTYASMSAA